MKYTTDNEIEKLLKETSSAFSPSREHFTKIIASLDMDTAHSTPKIFIPKRKTVSPYTAIFSQTFFKISTSAMVLFLGALGVYELQVKPASNQLTPETVATTIGTDTAGQTDTTNTAASNAPTNQIDSSAMPQTKMASLANNQPNQNNAALVNSVSKEMAAEQNASNDLFALNGM